MTEKDRILLRQAADANPFDWEYIERLTEEAESPEAIRELEVMAHWAFKRSEDNEFDND